MAVLLGRRVRRGGAPAAPDAVGRGRCCWWRSWPPGAGRLLPLGTGPEWNVALCAVGQGDALLLRPRADAGEGSTVLIDTGPDPAALRHCLDRLQVRRIDLLVLTHPHQRPHRGPEPRCTDRRTPQHQWICPLPDAAQQTVTQVPTAVATTGVTWRRPGLSLRVLWPDSAEDALRASAAEHSAGNGDPANDCSIVLDVLWDDGTRLLALGDLEPAAQQQLAALDPGPADIVKVAHHGSRFQHAPLYRQLDPDLALVPVGQDNSFGHPTDGGARVCMDAVGARDPAHRRPRHRDAPRRRHLSAAQRRPGPIGSASPPSSEEPP